MISYLDIVKETWHIIGSFLSFPALQSLARTCTVLNGHYGQLFWTHYFITNIVTYSEKESGAIKLLLKDIDGSKELFTQVWEHLHFRRIFNLTLKISAVSSLDRSEESPENTLSVSRCFYNLHPPGGAKNQKVSSLGLSAESSSQNTNIVNLYTGYRIQRQCGCAGGNPCYWSSHPSPANLGGAVDAAIEYLEIQLCSSVCFLSGFSVTPYRAYFHPEAPVYAPMEACIQVLEPSNENFVNDNYCVLPLNASKLLLNGADNVCYQSQFFPIANEFDRQVFFLSRPVLCLGGKVRIVFRGMHSRQLLGELGPPDTDDYYLCISNVSILAVPCEGYSVKIERAKKDTDLNDNRGKTCSIEAANPCLDDRDTLLVSLKRNDDLISWGDRLAMRSLERQEPDYPDGVICREFCQQHCIETKSRKSERLGCIRNRSLDQCTKETSDITPSDCSSSMELSDAIHSHGSMDSVHSHQEGDSVGRYRFDSLHPEALNAEDGNCCIQ